jgi:hypothetical protein
MKGYEPMVSTVGSPPQPLSTGHLVEDA